MNPSKKNKYKEENLQKALCDISIEDLFHVNRQVSKQSSKSHESKHTSDFRQSDEFEVANDITCSNPKNR